MLILRLERVVWSENHFKVIGEIAQVAHLNVHSALKMAVSFHVMPVLVACIWILTRSAHIANHKLCILTAMVYVMNIVVMEKDIMKQCVMMVMTEMVMAVLANVLSNQTMYVEEVIEMDQWVSEILVNSHRLKLSLLR